MTESSSESLPESTAKTPASGLVAPDAASATPVKKKPENDTISLALKLWWIPASYFIPYLFTYLFFAEHNSADSFEKAGKMGVIGLSAAALIYVIWFIDCKFGAKQTFARSKDNAAKVLVYLLGVGLWVSWLGVGIAMNMTYEQVNNTVPPPAMREQ